MFMTNIPRRKIYETMLEYEDGLMDMQVLLLSKQNYKNYLSKFEISLSDINRSYREIKALLVMFLENRKYEKAEDFVGALNLLVSDEVGVNNKLTRDLNLSDKFKKLIVDLDLSLKKYDSIDKLSFIICSDLFKLLDDFNSFVPKILELRRDEMK